MNTAVVCPGGFTTYIEPGDVAFARQRAFEGSVAALEKGSLARAKESARTRQGFETILREEERVVGAKALTLCLDEAAIGRAAYRDRFPVIFEVTAHYVPTLRLQVGLLGPL